MNAEIVTTGTELLLGEIVDTNAAYIARQLREVGVNLFYKTTVGDNRRRLAEVLQLGLRRSDVIIVTGGLGPTVDDITREAVADAVARPLELRPEIVTRLHEQFAHWGRAVSENNLRQAYLPQDALMLANPIGTAPGFIVETDQGAADADDHRRRVAILCLPGVPREMKRMMADHVLPYLQARIGAEAGVILARVLHTAGIGESVIDDLIGDLMTAGNPTVGLAAHMGRVDVRLAARAPSIAAAQALLAPLERAVRAKLHPWIFGMDEETLAGVVAGLLRQSVARLALAETNTAGAIAAGFAGPDQDVLALSLAAADLSDLGARLGLTEPLTLNETAAIQVAEALYTLAGGGALYALALLGGTDPEQGFWQAQRGETWLAVRTPAAVQVEQIPVGGGDEFTREWLTIFALNTLRKRLQGSG